MVSQIERQRTFKIKKFIYFITKVKHVKRKMEVKMRAIAETRRTWPK